ncbi:hypothetical protein D0T84_05460 [Dysgonomonas sp. 521]|uniref:hypothetical protein n=1 Tax=Dysgonomonas sp. 521 TaxID=2302932 RepID=UPI0013D66214|nr:hypothetical protein [Dysgonomonas sp. 521]NDV94366.1 hypothetical protein [Dysgonomonas sp. 521]
MRKFLFLIVVFCFCNTTHVFGQVIVFEGECCEALAGYKTKYDNDSTVVSNFRSFYQIEMSEMAKAELFKKKPAEIIAFFNTDAGKKNQMLYKRLPKQVRPFRVIVCSRIIKYNAAPDTLL